MPPPLAPPPPKSRAKEQEFVVPPPPKSSMPPPLAAPIRGRVPGMILCQLLVRVQWFMHFGSLGIQSKPEIVGNHTFSTVKV